jgi:hypothetical protein
VLSTLLGPGAQRRAEETRLRTEAKREVVQGARSLIAEVHAGAWGGTLDFYFDDPRYLAVRRHLRSYTRGLFGERQFASDVPAGEHPMPVDALADDIDRLEREWKLT